MTFNTSDLADFGWTAFFNSQLDIDDLQTAIPVRVMAVHRGSLDVANPGLDMQVPPLTPTADDEETVATVGDWLLLDHENYRPLRLLRRKSLFKRRAPGTARKLQLIAANVDTLFIVSSCNADFNAARLERYLALAREAGVTPVIVLTKADQTDTPEEFVGPAAKLRPGVLVEAVDARDADSVACLTAWCASGQTVALLGSSGVGKSTLANTLIGTDRIDTQGIREDDAKGRHTTTARALHRLPTNGWLLDTPGMRELQLTDAKAGLEEVFADIVELAETCRFSDCGHETEPGCAVLAAVETGALEPGRLKRWRKLVAEDARNTESIADRRARERGFGKMVKGIMKAKRQREKE